VAVERSIKNAVGKIYKDCEMNSVVKDPAAVDIRFAMCFPDVYVKG